MSNKLDALDIDLDDGFETIKPEPKEDPIGDVDINLDDIDTSLPVKDEVKEELKSIPPKESLSDIDISLDEPVKQDVLIELDEAPKVEVKPEVKVETPKIEAELEINLDLDEPVKTTVVDTVANTEVPGDTIKSDIPENIEIDLEVSQTPTTEVPAKKGRKPKAKKNTEGLKNVGSKKQYSGQYDPIFPMSKIITGKYNVRHTMRTPEEIAELASDIKFRGQLEPMHLVKEGEEFHLIAGYGRFEAMSKLGIETCRAIFYENLQPDDVFGIATGTNQKRVEFTAWDMIVSFVKFNDLHKNIPITSTDDTEQTVCSIFGIGKTTAYSYLDIYSYLKDKECILNVLKTKKIPYHALLTIHENRVPIENTKALPKIAEALDKVGETTRSQFKEIVEFILNNKVDDIEIDTSTTDKVLEKELSISPEVDKITEKQIEKEVSTIAVDHNVESIKILEENSKYVNDKVKELLENLTFINQSMLDILAKENLYKLIDPTLSTSLKKGVKEVTSLASKLVG